MTAILLDRPGTERRRDRSAVSDQRIVEIDGLRGIAVSLVLVWHFIGAVLPKDGSRLTGVLGEIFIFGRTGVDLFFVLSGFLIIGILADRRDSANYFSVFYARRSLRILPPYLLLIGIFWAITEHASATNPYFNESIPLWSYLTFTQTWNMIEMNAWGPGGASVTWSVAVEEQFYLAFPLIVYLTPPRYLKWVLVSLGIASAIARAWCQLAFPENDFAPYVFMPLRLDGLCAGGLIALAYRDREVFGALIARRKLLLRLLLACAAMIPPFLYAIKLNLDANMYLWGHTYLTVFYSLALLNILTNLGSPRLQPLRGSALRAAGRISYGLYLFHPLFIALVFMAFHRGVRLASLTDAALLATALGLSVAFCTASFHLMERRCLAFGHRIRYRPREEGSVRPMFAETPTAEAPLSERGA